MRYTTPRAVLAGACIAAGSFGGTAAATTTSRHASAAARQFLADTAPLARASAHFEAVALGWLGAPVTNAAATAAAAPLVRTFVALEHRLSHQSWPAPARAHVFAVERTTERVVADLAALRHDDLKKPASWEAPLLADQVALTGAINAVRRNLGLSPLTS